MAAEGDIACRRVIGDAGRLLGVQVANLCNLLNPRRVIVAGTLASAGEILLEPLRSSLSRRALPDAAATVDVVVAELGDRATALGAVALALHESGTLDVRRRGPPRVGGSSARPAERPCAEGAFGTAGAERSLADYNRVPGKAPRERGHNPIGGDSMSSSKRFGAMSVALVLTVALAACSKSSPPAAVRRRRRRRPSAAPISISADSFTADFSAMAQLESLASQGKGMIGVLLPDTTTSARYERTTRRTSRRRSRRPGSRQTSSRSTTPRAAPARCRRRPRPTSPTGATVLLVDADRLRQRRGHRGQRRRQGRQGHRLRPPDAGRSRRPRTT